MTDEARADWEERIGRREVPGQAGHRGPAAGLARPARLRATCGQGHVTLDWDPVPGAAYMVRHYRIDAGHSNIVPAWERMRRGAPWPSDDQWAELQERNTLDELGPPERAIAGGDGLLEFGFDLPMPGVSGLELIP